MYSVHDPDPFHRIDSTFINNILYDQDFYNSFVSHIRNSSIIHYNIKRKINNLFDFLNDNNNNYDDDSDSDSDSDERSDEEIHHFQQYGSDCEWEGEMSEDDSDDSGGNDDHQGGNLVNQVNEKVEGQQIAGQDSIYFDLPNNVPIPLICPITQETIVIPAKTMFCKHNQCFDLNGYITHSCNTGRWICPFCLTETGPFNLIIDILFEDFLNNNNNNNLQNFILIVYIPGVVHIVLVVVLYVSKFAQSSVVFVVGALSLIGTDLMHFSKTVFELITIEFQQVKFMQ
ncbi:hypothetical protein ACTFIW_002749 [Dictyostelium discoideum]